MRVLLANGSEYPIVKNVERTSEMVDGTYVSAIKLYISGDIEPIKTEFTNPDNLSLITLIADDNSSSAEFSGYEKLVRIGFSPDDATEECPEVYTVLLAIGSDVKKLINLWSGQVENVVAQTKETKEVSEQALKISGETSQIVSDMIPETNIENMEIDQAKEFRIKESKEKLSDYLSLHPIYSTCHNKEGEYYSITSEKQQYLISMIAIAEMAQASGVEYQPSWNSTGNQCTYDWTVDQLKQLAFEMETTVRPLVSKQQKYENEINECSTIEELKNITIVY